MPSPFIGEIRIFGFNFAPAGWAVCDGQLMPISQNTALFSILGTTYGGNGTSTFALPNLQGMVALHQGHGAGLSPYPLGEQTGTATVALTNVSELPGHSHAANCYNGAGNSYTGANAVPAIDAGGNNLYSSPSNAAMNPLELAPAGSAEPHNNLQPYLVLNYCIALFGVFPSRN